MKKYFFIVTVLVSVGLSAQIDRIEPPFWWSGMNNEALQIMLHGDDIAGSQVELEYPGVVLKGVTSLESPNYLFLNIEISEAAKSGSFTINLKKGKKRKGSFSYELKQRKEGSAERASFGTQDVLYLITPDRYANGNPANDEVGYMKEKLNRTFKGGRHGGDIEGMKNSLDYIADLGFTAVWMNPLLENDMPEYSYHGYSTTDFYKVDPRFGSNQEYQDFVRTAHSKGIKIIMDMIVNHCGSEHWWMDDFPSSDWLNYQKETSDGGYQETTHRKTVIQDPYASDIDLKEFTDGWFVRTMPDLNQRNPYMAKYLIQNAIWWIEYLDLDGIRMDTYPYPGKEFMADWTCAVQNEYPNFNTVGEEWYNDPAILAHWQQGKENANGYTSCLPSLMDFPLQTKVTEALNAEQGTWSGWLSIYTTLGLDFLYADPFKMVVFPDNHDMSRFYTQVNEDFDLFKLGVAFYATVRGTPQFYYGTEILMTNPGTSDHGIIRSDFPGGWEGDEVNAFSGDGLTDRQKEAKRYFSRVLNWRKDSDAIHNGELKHYNPKDGLYVFFRYSETDKVMVVLSKNSKAVDLKLDRFKELLSGNETGRDVISGASLELKNVITVPPMTPMIIDID